ncbi:MAG: PASTA domain-containing protein [Actinobacteria bacterium]|nr:PASTA domain-containing protein [Actinomycetota bacterium]
MSPLPFFRRREPVEPPPDEVTEDVARPGEEDYVVRPEDEAATEYIVRPEDEPTEYVGPPVAEEYAEYAPPAAERRVTRVTEEPPRRVVPPERNPWPWLLALLLLVLGGIAAAYFLTRDDDESAATATVPNVVGQRANAATARLRADGFTPVTRRQYSNEPRGEVLRQEPAAGRTLREGGTVTLFASRGAATATVPNLRGLSEAEAASELTERGLRANVFRVPSTEPDGTVVAQNPAADEVVKKGSAVRVNVSRGQTTTTTETTTTTTTTTTTPTTTGATGATPPPPPQAVDVPDVVGQTEADAAAALADVGLLADSYPVAAQDPSGTVVAQRPAAGGTAEEGSAVRINVSIGPDARPERAVPDVTGVDERVARARLRRVGLTVRAIPRTVTKPDQNGVVILQAPNAGLRLQLRAQVTIYVGRLRP